VSESRKDKHMSFSTILKTIGKDLSHVAGWIEDGLKVAAPVIGTIDPPLGAIFTEVENVLGSLTGTAAVPAATLATLVQQIVTAIATLEGIKSTAPAPSATATASVTPTAT
jgi:hypothetical protein